MNRTSTLNYSIHNFSSKLAPELSDIDQLFDQTDEFEEVYDYLENIECDVRQKIVDMILKKAADA